MRLATEVLMGLLCLLMGGAILAPPISVDWSSMDNDPEMNTDLEDDDV